MKTQKTCCVCGEKIPAARLEALPNTKTCVEHSTVKPYHGFQVFPHKTGSQCVLVDPNNEESMRLASRAYHRER
jgi:hypothetical protein